MAQITIYLDEASEAAAREAAAKANMSVSRWFAQFAHAERVRQDHDWVSFWKRLDAIKGSKDYGVPSEASTDDLSEDIPRESF